MLDLAKRKNAVIKVSGACTLSREPYPFPDIWDPLARVFDAWGLDRCLWGTDWTRAFAVVNYEQAVEPFRMTKRLSDSDRAVLMGGACAKACQGSEVCEDKTCLCQSPAQLCDGKCAGKGATLSCQSAPPPNPCADVGDLIVPGLYCGDSLAMAPSDLGYGNLYSCQIDPTTKQWVSPATTCAKGCSPQPSGVADRCQ